MHRSKGAPLRQHMCGHYIKKASGISCSFYNIQDIKDHLGFWLNMLLYLKMCHNIEFFLQIHCMSYSICLLNFSFSFVTCASLLSGEYVAALRKDSQDPLVSLCIGITFIHLASQKFARRRNSLIVQVCELPFDLYVAWNRVLVTYLCSTILVISARHRLCLMLIHEVKLVIGI